MLRTRVLTAAVLLILLVGVARWAPPRGFDLLLLIIVSLAFYEWMRLLNTGMIASVAAAIGFALLGITGLTTFPSVIAAAQGIGSGVLPLYLLATVIWVIAVPIALNRFSAIGGERLAGRAVAFALCLATWLALIQADGLGKIFLLSVLLLVWVADTAAYFAGRGFGRRKLAPSISPGKTLEGVIGALVGNLVLAVLVSQFALIGPDNPAGSVFALLQSSLGWGFLIAFVVMITLVSVIGDLYESLLKRLRGVKDSGRVLPGHGGVLDRIDALIAVFPVTMGVVSLVQSGLL
ncbi:MAG: phosphatidate cytidylyltransferase [Burkholderiaceae bacterium]|nr:phosphatidate cytidylyltransferase [Burkholderiaceae bacterium]